MTSTQAGYGTAEIGELLRLVAEDVATHADELRDLDAKLGDGDLGVTVRLFAKGVAEFVAAEREEDAGAYLVKCGLHLNRMNPSTFGTIVTVGLVGAGKSVSGKNEITLDDAVGMAEAAVEAIQKRGRAQPGDKTLLDALVPATEALARAHSQDLGAEAISIEVVAASEEGMRSTIGMAARVGRARMFDQTSVGTQDPGATAMHYMIASAASHAAEVGR